ncbi:pyruvate-ferredoxin/flavodoxin oxidoreductase [Ruminococcus sp. YE71]|uniref:pyruvate:ferredoxin (flavodoxin) oxidoreductase n=1 Tax=unclassified Ruminococcus TaxID=2608920 RepID=UPI0008824EA6|nr:MULTISPECIES: pyruvate:ferredoxin (flavodoxin) oxidoreductase [unclassified Ruminococcus]SDA09733.1 pyruvate-ferredoxin/flavodoxin oxidoreductase [Ruminococcus sp. YE78]SFW11506.1 pyruvate-ferredoxin/flavodoxin oxidoreductase [Ruminococcus sp. YE71]
MARKMKTMDGNNAAAWASYPFTEVAAIYPITPSSVMAEVTDQWSAKGQTNIFGTPVKVAEMQSEAGASGTVHGSLSAGALTTTYTASQGLLLMIPNMYKIAGELLPCVIHVSARCVASHALNIFGDHSDVYACRQTGFAMLCSSNPQEVMDLGTVAHLSTIKGRVPFLHFFDGFRTSHEIQKIETWDKADVAEMVDMDAVQAFRDRAINPEHPVLRGTAQNGDIFFQAREACNKYYDAVPAVVEEYMEKVNAKIGTNYKLFNYYGAEDATHVIIAMGSVCDTIEETIDYLNSKEGTKLGLVKVRLYRPFCADKLVEALPDTVEQISVLDRTKEPGSLGEPLWLDVVAALKGTKFHDVVVSSGRYGLGSKDTTPSQIKAVYWNASWKDSYKPRFTIGITDDVTNLSLDSSEKLDTAPAGTTACKFWGLGADGTVGANKNSIKIIGDHTDLYAQAYFAYDSKKSGGVTVSHLRFGKTPIKSTYLINMADFVACHNESYIDKYDMVSDIKPGGTFLLNCQWTEKELDKHLPGQVKRYIAENNIKFYIINGVKIGKEIGLGNRINTVLQSAFFKLANIIPIEDAVKYMKDAATASYSKKGEAIVKMNHDAIDAGYQQVVEVKVPDAWKKCKDTKMGMDPVKDKDKVLQDFVNNIQIPCNAQKGDTLPVSTFVHMADGTFPQGSAAFEKRGIAVDVPAWNNANCIQCNFCSYVCPHAVIRPVIMTEAELAKAPALAKEKAVACTGMPGYFFVMTMSALDCTGCGSCVNVCPGKKGEKALSMMPLETQLAEQEVFNYGLTLADKPEVHEKFKETTVKGSQFKQPLLEFSGACAGCGETPYAKLITQLFGDRMYIANATGCSSIWGGSAPSTPYTKNKDGKGPAWANSLFEDNAEYGYGMFLAQNTIRKRTIAKIEELAKTTKAAAVKDACENFLATANDGAKNSAATDELVAALVKSKTKAADEILKDKDYLRKKSMWVFGGDGWAYDIGFSGVDHVLASGEDVNIFVFDTEVYSNTGGQSSKSTPTGAIAQFAAAGKEVKKKDLAGIAMTYGYVYVAHIAMGADYNQCIKAIAEAEAYPGPSLIIAYAPCINHGIKGGMKIAQTEEKKAVEAGYWHLYRYNPALKAEGKNPFVLDSKEPKADYKEFLMGEVRYNALARQNPERAEQLFTKAVKNAQDRYDYLLRYAKLYNDEDKK